MKLPATLRRDLGYGDVDRKKRRPARKKNPRKAAKLYADRCCREYAKKRWVRCVTCGKVDNLQWAHLLTSAAESTRWDLYNFAVQCAGCNLRHEYDPSPMTVWFLHTYGERQYDLLAARHHSPAHYKAADLVTIGDHYKKLIEDMI